MNKIGSLGPVVFVVGPEAIRTFAELSRSSAGRWANHEVLGKKPISQFIGPGLDTVSFTMRFDVRYRINPRKELSKLVELERAGKAMPLIVGGQGLGVNKWKITSLEQSWEEIDGKGNLLKATATITLEEYL
ncbi:phage tail protein [Paenibacillus faecis]|uniref:Phage tail protein n=1 Tax=Paenibacillus faecis TaxID=862114 RepID=A0A5D0CP02_9BACL|nr:phage tail protein [Paenibacillus faecis]TYA10935.1 phage tail protein [Paenibacillus faecis]